MIGSTAAALGLLLLAALPRAASSSPRRSFTTTVRVTWYDQAGTMADGANTYPGAAACSADLPFGATVTFDDGFTATCEDRGLLGAGDPISWIDVFQGTWLTDEYGDTASVTITTP